VIVTTTHGTNPMVYCETNNPYKS